MRRIIVSLAVLTFVLAFQSIESDAAYRVGGTAWLVEGGGFVEKDFLRVSLNDAGTLRFTSQTQGDREELIGYEMSGELNATGLGINAWRYSGRDEYEHPIMIEDFNPSMSNPLKLPSFVIDDLTYTVEFTSVTSGRVMVKGYIDVDVVGRCEVKGENVIWKAGTPKPKPSSEASGCDSGASWLAFPCLLAAHALRGRRLF
ncbi:MAG: hypothetical protein LBS75_03580 [Synergistaceae bacterium]|jgi:hypothetical protein|nr:hypothetical protein [Synergistaceae bacterium]